MDDVTWGALTLTLTVIGAVWTWFAFRNRGLASGLRGSGLTLLPVAAWLTGTMEMFTEIGGSVVDWATSLVLSPLVWIGIILAGMSVVLLGVSGALRERGRGGRPAASAEPSVASPTDRRSLPRRTTQKGEPVLGDDVDDMAEIEALLKRRGIT